MSHPVTVTERPTVARYLDVRRVTAELCSGLSPDDAMLQSMPEASPAKWHLAHTTWFFETFLLLPHARGYRAFDPQFTFVFNSYYKSLEGHPERARRGLFSRPSLDEVRAYRAHVDEQMARWIEAGVPAEIEPLLELGLNHEQQHQELIVTDVKHAFWSQPLRPAYRPSTATAGRAADAPPLEWIDFEGGVYALGHEGPGFAFDNEGPRHDALLRPFRLASRLVTNAEFLAFIDDGGYRHPDLWLSDGWDLVMAQRWRAPLYWEERDGRWSEFRCDGTRELEAAAPACHVSYFEAEAYARWAGARLATEQEWEVAAAAAPRDGAFLEDELFHPAPARGQGLRQMFGDCWEWTASPYVGYPGYRPAAGALGEYNGKFMCGQLVLRGGSCATPRSHIRATYRNFFPPAARWQFAGIRLAR